LDCNFLLDYLEEKHVFNSPFQSIIDTFALTLAEIVVEYDRLGFFSSYSVAGMVFF
jgi:hypothetical protein